MSSDEQFQMRQVSHNRSALASLFGWPEKPKPLGFEGALVGQVPDIELTKARLDAIQAELKRLIESERAAEPELPALGSGWEHKDGGRVVVTGIEGSVVCYRVKSGPLGRCEVRVFVRNFTPVATPAPSFELIAPRFGEVWRRNSDGKEMVCVNSKPDDEQDYKFHVSKPEGGRSEPIFSKLAWLNANYTRVPPQPTPNTWRPIAEWDARDRSKRHICFERDAPLGLVLAHAKGGFETRSASWMKGCTGVSHFIEIDLPEVPNE